ncbi:hypothetical protein FMUND_9125 [Fusarium mundagurra]|uniref:BTB domain-containing protein n=1 Tax=Fusarium mundagurra TaxID=1567541 RepID=A0A8H5YGG4_9HYPO|nr:hypothetical protein FMUND_9125 [Fusarium mundagurra]
MKTSILTFSPKGDTELILRRPNFRKRNEPKDESTAKETAPENEVEKLDDTINGNGQPAEDQLSVPDVYFDLSSSIHNTDDLKTLKASDDKFFKAMLDGPFSEGIRNKDNLFEVKAFEWNAEALVILLDIIHGHHRSLPQKVELDVFIEIAMLCDYYQCEEIVETFAKQWYTAFEEDKEEDKPYEEEATMNWIFIAWVFQRGDMFNSMVAATLQHSRIPVHTDLPLPSTIIEKLEAQRLKLINKTLNNLYGLHESLWVTDNDCTPQCASMLLGSLMKQMRQAGLEIPKPKGPPSTIRSLVGLRNFIWGLQTPVWYFAPGYSGLSKHECSFKDRTKPWMDDITKTYKDGVRFEDFRDALNCKARSRIEVKA